MLPYFKKALLISLAIFCGVPQLTQANTAGVNPVTLPSSPGGGAYQPISGVPFGGSGFGGMLSQIFVWGVTMTIILAVIMLVVGGVQYMGSESLFGKDEGKKRITAALGGLLIAFLSIFILNLILGTGGEGPFKVGSF